MADGLAEEIRLVRECRLGRSEAFGPLVAHYQNAVYATARGFVRDHQDAQDIVQESPFLELPAAGSPSFAAVSGHHTVSTWG